MMKILTILMVVTGILCEEISKEYIHSNNIFCIKLLGELDKGHGNNLVYSSFSPETILALMTLGSKGNTATEIKKVLQLPISDEKIKNEYEHVHTEIEQTKNVEITSANQVYLAKGFNAEAAFVKTANETFRAGVQNVDFGNSQKAVDDINAWVEEKTNKKIKNLLSKDQISDLTRMVLVNALYFKGHWQHPFDPEQTQKRDFHVSKTETVQVDTMKVTADLYVDKMDEHNVTYLMMPFAGTQNRVKIRIVIPHDVDGLDRAYEDLETTVPAQNYTKEYMKLYLPKFKIESSIDMKPILKNMGILEIFDKPDFSGITKEAIKVDSFVQKAFIDVNEFGTEAAAATAAISIARTLLIPKAIASEYHVDRPFFFCILLDEVAIVTGRVKNPLLG